MRDEVELKRILHGHMKEICHYSQMQVFATSTYQRNYFQLQIDEVIEKVVDMIRTNQALVITEQQWGAEEERDLEEVEEAKQRMELSTEERGAEDAASAEIPLREVTLEELIENDGTKGKAAYVAVNGIVYDVSNSNRWTGGWHYGVTPGRDLTEDFINCHDGMSDILKVLPKVGTLIQ